MIANLDALTSKHKFSGTDTVPRYCEYPNVEVRRTWVGFRALRTSCGEPFSAIMQATCKHPQTGQTHRNSRNQSIPTFALPTLLTIRTQPNLLIQRAWGKMQLVCKRRVERSFYDRQIERENEEIVGIHCTRSEIPACSDDLHLGNPKTPHHTPTIKQNPDNYSFPSTSNAFTGGAREGSR